MKQLFSELDLRRRELGMSHAVLAQKARLSLPTVQRILSGHQTNASWANVLTLAEALGMTIDVRSVANAEDLREQQARRKAEHLVKMVQGTSGLEGQALDQQKFDQMLRRTVHELLAGPDRKLWSE